jgi:sodium transport system permease protein
MRWRFIAQVTRKELLSTLRDRRAIVSNLLIPLLLVPLLVLGLPLALEGLVDRERGGGVELAVQGWGEVPMELRTLLHLRGLQAVAVDDAGEAVASDRFSVGLGWPGATLEAPGAPRSEVAIYLKEGNLRSELHASGLRSALLSYRELRVQQRLRAVGVDPAVLEPFALQSVDVSLASERGGGVLAFLIPLFIVVWTLSGGQMAAIDATAGEKERGTLEVLLVAPVRRTEVVLGKFLAVTTFGLMAALMAILGFVVAAMLLRDQLAPRFGIDAELISGALGGELSITPVALLILVVSSLLLAMLIAALLMSLALFARSFKEAQSYIAPLSLVVVLPAFALQLRDLIGEIPGAAWIPIFNAMLLIDDAVKGTVDASSALRTFAALLLAVLLLLLFAARNFHREDVLFRSTS